MIEQTKPIAESRNFIVLNTYTQEWKGANTYQSEIDLEQELIRDLADQGYEYLSKLTTPDAMLANLRAQLQTLNNVQFSDDEWQRFVQNWLDKPSDGIIEKTRKIHPQFHSEVQHCPLSVHEGYAFMDRQGGNQGSGVFVRPRSGDNPDFPAL